MFDLEVFLYGFCYFDTISTKAIARWLLVFGSFSKRMLREFVGFMATLRYEPCTQFINVLQRALHIYWQFSAMSHAIHKIVSQKRCQSYFSSRRSPHHAKSKNRDL